MKNSPIALMLLMLLVTVSILASNALGDISLQYQWTLTTSPTTSGSFLYLNDNVKNGNLMAGKIGTGVFEINRSGSFVNSIYTNTASVFGGSIGAMSAASMGDNIYIGKTPNTYGDASTGGIYRFDATGPNAWNTSSLVEVRDTDGNRIGADSLTTNGTYLFTTITNSSDPSFNGDSHQDRVTAYSLNASNQLVQQWQTDVGSNKSIYGLSYGGNGYVYGVDAADGGTGTIWAFDAGTGTATALASYRSPGTDRWNFYTPGAGTFGTAVDGDWLYIVGTGGYLSVFHLDTPASLSGRQDFDIGADLIANGVQSPNKPVALTGVAADNNFLWIAFEADDDYDSPGMNHRVVGYLVPEPGTMALLGLGGLGVLWRRRSRKA